MSPPPDAKGRRRVSLGLIATLIVFVFFVVVVISSVFGWRQFFKPDGDEPILLELAFQDAALMERLMNESAIRLAEDMRIMSLQANLSDAINEEIRIRTEEDALLLRLLLEEIFNRTQKQNALYAGVAQEKADRIAGDAAINATLSSLEHRIEVVQEYDDWAAIKFMIVMQNITDIYNRLQQEIAERIGNETILLAQLAQQQQEVTDLQTALAAETAARIAKDMVLMTQVNSALAGEIIFIDGTKTLTNKFYFESANPGYVFGVGSPSNVLTLSNEWLVTLNNVYPDPVTSDYTLLPGINTNITFLPDTNEVHFSMINLPVEPNQMVYFGWMDNPNVQGLGSNSFPINAYPLFVHLGSGWNVDFSRFGAGNIIQNFNTPDMRHWKIPTSNGKSIGTYLLKAQIAVGLYLNAPFIGPGGVSDNYPSYSFANIVGGICLSTDVTQCINGQTLSCNNATCTLAPIMPLGQKAFNNYDSTRWTDVQQGILNGFFVGSGQFSSAAVDGYLAPMFVIIDISTVINGYYYPLNTRVYPVWQLIDADRQFQLSDTFSTSVSITYDITRLQ